MPQDEGNNHEGSNRVGPPKVPNRVESKANQSDQGEIEPSQLTKSGGNSPYIEPM